jgi:hypothetical protein
MGHYPGHVAVFGLFRRINDLQHLILLQVFHVLLVCHGRKTGETGDSTGFALPADRTIWSYNANHRSLLKWAEKYEDYEDDGQLKFFCFGVHSIDFERDNNWNELEEFARKYGDRPSDYWYATVADIFDYEDAVKALKINDTSIINYSDVKLYVKIDGVEKIIEPKSTFNM